MNSSSRQILMIQSVSQEIFLRFIRFSHKITEDHDSCHSRESRFTQVMKCEITLTLDSRNIFSPDVGNTGKSHHFFALYYRKA